MGVPIWFFLLKLYEIREPGNQQLCTFTFTVHALFQFLERSKETHPLGRAGDPDEVAAAIGKDKSCFKSIDRINIQRKHSLP